MVKEGVHKDNIKVIYSEDLAFEAALKDAEPGDLIIMFYEDFEPVYKVMQAFREKLEKSCGEQISKVHEAVSAG